MQGDCQNQQRAPLPGCLYPLFLLHGQTGVQVGQYSVGQPHENPAPHESDYGSKPWCLSHLLSHFNAGRQKRPKAGGNHNSCSKS